MKWKLSLVFILFVHLCPAQKAADPDAIDSRVSQLDAPTPDSLAMLLTACYPSEMEKTRAIFSWIAQHIEYNTGIVHHAPQAAARFAADFPDTAAEWKSGLEMSAWRVMRRKVAVCEGYAKLFKVLCDKSGLQAEVISGYAKCYGDRGGPFRTNHTWNAVRIDGQWYLLDVTWASGYLNYAGEYVRHLDEHYFLTPPSLFIEDHYPENLRWALLNDPPGRREFNSAPYRLKSFIKYGIRSFSPGQGVIDAAVGDTVQLELEVKDAAKNKLIAPDPFFDSSMLTLSPASVFLEPSFCAKKVVYTYVVGDLPVEWLNLMYNEDAVMRYRLRVKKDPR